MKRLFSFAAATALSLSLATSAFAHSHLKSSNPEDGDTVTSPLTEIMLTFDGKIEIGSAIDVIGKKGGNITVEEIKIGDGSLTGTLAEPLPNDEYEIQYSIISADGHPIEGDFSFDVAVEGGVEAVATNATTTTEDEGSSMVVWIVGAVVLIGAAAFLLRRKK